MLTVCSVMPFIPIVMDISYLLLNIVSGNRQTCSLVSAAVDIFLKHLRESVISFSNLVFIKAT
jgi:hypothetical protein